MIRERIEEALREAGCKNFTVERPSIFKHGDYATNAALVNKVDVQELANKLKIEGVEKIEVAGKFINFFLSREAILEEIQNPQIPALYADKKILVEYTSPNLFKSLHIGNLIGNILGESIARLLKKTGATVVRINYPSDIGLTVAKGVWGLWKQGLDPSDIAELGKAYVAGNAAYEDGSAKEEIEAINRALYENSNSEWSALRAQGVETSRRHLDDLCEKLGTKFDKEFFESEAGVVGEKIVRANVDKVFEESDGAVIYKGAHTRVFLTSQGFPTYEAKEVGLFELKAQSYPDFDISLTVTGSEQKDFFAVVFDAIAKLFPKKIAGKALRHVANGFLRLTTGKMSSRLGNVITGESLIEDLTKAARGRQDVAVGAIKYAVLKQGSGRDIAFDPDKSLSLEGDSGPYVQYALVRTRSLLREAAKAGLAVSGTEAEDRRRSGPLGQVLPSPIGLVPSAARPLERVLLHYPDALARAAREMEPHYLTTYLTELAGAFNSWYASERVIGGENPEYGVFLVSAVEHTLREGLETLGIPTPEEM